MPTRPACPEAACGSGTTENIVKDKLFQQVGFIAIIKVGLIIISLSIDQILKLCTYATDC